MPFTIITQPEFDPVTWTEAMAHAVVENNDDIDLIRSYITAFTLHGQHITGRQFVEATFELDLEAFPEGKIFLKPNLNSVLSVKYKDSNENIQTLDESAYVIRKTGLIGYLTPLETWPSDVYSPADVIVTFKAGWPIINELPTTPEDIKAWIMVRVAGLYEQRENFVLSKGGRFGVANMPRDFIDSVLDSYIVPGIGAGI